MLIVGPAVVLGMPSFQTRIPNADAVTGCDGSPHPGVGHLRAGGGGARNPFGADFAAAGNSWTTGLCQADSDGDGRSNGDELGDPDCTWLPGDTPRFTVGITHPGINCGNLDCDGTVAGDAAPAAPIRSCDLYSGATSESVDFTFGGHPVAAGTSYVKGAFTWPAPTAAGVLRFEVVNVQPDVVHHMILYRCPADMAATYGTPGTGSSMGCSDVLMAWAVGGSDFCAPEGLGFVVDPASPYFLLEIHYDNPAALTGVVDASGMRLHYVPWQSSGLQEANVVLAGARLQNVVVPPRRQSYRATVTIPSSMIGMPDGYAGVDIFAVIQHMHGIGRKQWLSAVDEATDAEEAEVACNTNYDFDLQEATFLPTPFRLRPRRSLVLDCVYDSSSRDETTHGGDATEDEMCIIALMYSGPSANGGLLSPQVTLGDDPAGGVHVCHRTAAAGTNGTAPCNGTLGSISGAGAAGGGEADYERARTLLVAHGAMMLVAWGLLLPLGAAVAACWRAALPGGRWFRAHLLLQGCGLALTACGLVLAVYAVELLDGDHFAADVASGHKTLGLLVAALAAVQLAAALLRPHKPPEGSSPGAARVLWAWSHRLVALGAIALALGAAMTGSRRLEQFFVGEGGFDATAFQAIFVSLLGVATVVCGGVGRICAARSGASGAGGEASMMKRGAVANRVNL